ncbi:MAG: metallophosphoesterase family protein [Proteobacteria bacterium]|nr:metallophosphoesterase family protein [Pseudomonadota bacterium]
MIPFRLVPALVLLAACDMSPAEEDTDPVAVINQCSPELTVPGVLGEIDEDRPVQSHEDTFGSEQADPMHVRYNWPGRDPSTQAAFLWRTDLETLATVVEYGTDGDLDQRVEGGSFRFGGAASGDGDHRIHEVKLCEGLEPDTTYSYRVGGEGHWSPTYTFTTPGAPGSFESFRFAMVGDSRGAYETWGTVLELIDAHDPNFIIFSGDAVEAGPNQEEWDAWFEASGDIFASTAVVPAHGNHEFLSSNYFAQFSLGNNEQWYSVEYGSLHLVNLNDTVASPEHRSEDQVEFMNEVWAETPDSWKMANQHQSIYATCTNHGSNLDVREMWEPVFDSHEVDVVVAGHNHIYERSLPIRNGAAVDEADGTLYLVTGGAGAPLYNNTSDEWFGDIANPIEHYIIADVTADKIDFVVRDLSNNIIDEFSKTRR